ncbi:unnamed protein product [Polarella glacialis]|nr:unnamed protein product [Polarella glacialis]
MPSVPTGFQPFSAQEEASTCLEQLLEYEDRGLEELGDCCFVIPAGGLGERLGFSGVKFALTADLTSGCCVLAVYASYIKAFEALAQARRGKPCTLPLVIMASSDTETGIKELLERNNHFDLEPSQVSILLQEKVASLADSNATLAMEGPYQIATKPHGHGDVHFLLHSSGLVAKWQAEGRKWVLFFQDTNTLYLMTFLCTLGVSARHGLEVNFVAMPRCAKEAVGAITQLRHSDGRSIVVNVEYNQLEPLLKATGHPEGDVNGPDGLSPFPGNCNELLFSLPEYAAELQSSGGQLVEFINPKYADSSRTAFKSPTRLECMMQDYAKVLGPQARVSFTRYPLEFGYFPCKNDIATAARLASEGTPPHGAASSEAAVYHAFGTMLSLLGAKVAPAELRQWRGGPQLMGPAVVLWPDFAPCFAELRRKLGSSASSWNLAPGCSLEIQGQDIRIDALDLAGALKIRVVSGASLHIQGLRVQNKGHEFVALSEAEQSGEAPESLRIRGYRLVAHETKVIEVLEPGAFVLDLDGELKKV